MLRQYTRKRVGRFLWTRVELCAGRCASLGVLGRAAFAIGAVSHINLSFPLPDVLPGGATGQWMVDALVTTLFDVAMQ
jgi:hypothetical protein